jgi:hypothetical protein
MTRGQVVVECSCTVVGAAWRRWANAQSIGCSLGDSRFSASERYVGFCGRSADGKIYENKGRRGLSRYEDNATSQSC